MPPPPPKATVVQPWAEGGGRTPHAAAEGRPCLLVPAAVDRVRLGRAGPSLPMLCQFTDARGFRWKKVELPATDVPGENARAQQPIDCALVGPDGSWTSVRIELRRGLSRPAHFLGKDGLSEATDPSLANHRSAASAAEEMLDQHLSLLHELQEAAAGNGEVFHSGLGSGVGAWPLSQVVDVWRAGRGLTGTVAVRLSRELRSVLQDVCDRPRWRVVRRRQAQHPARIREMDALCLRRLVEQPGWTRSGKPGPKQRAAGIVRTETVDTPENRVVRTLLDQLRDVCERFFRQRADGRVAEEVAAFHRQVQRLSAGTPIGRLSRVEGIPPGDGACQHDPRYRKLWRTSVSLFHRSRQAARTWPWRSRVWAERSFLATIGALHKTQPVSIASRSSVLLRPGPEQGRIIDPRTAIGRWDRFDAGTSLVLLEGWQLGNYRLPEMDSESLTRPAPDFALVQRNARRPDTAPIRVLLVWAVFDFDVGRDGLRDRCREIASALPPVRAWTEVKGLLLQPKLGPTHSPTGGDDDRPTDVAAGNCRGLRIGMPVQEQEVVLERAYRELLEEP